MQPNFLVDLGCGDRKVDGTFGVDFRPLPGVDLVADITTLTPDQLPQPAQGIFVRHALEHFPLRDGIRLLVQWTQLLAPGGFLHIEVPRMDFIARHWNDRPNDVSWHYWLLEMAYGSQDYEGNFHKTLYSPDILHHQMCAAGLAPVEIQRVTQVVVGRGIRPLDWQPPSSTHIEVSSYPVTWVE